VTRCHCSQSPFYHIYFSQSQNRKPRYKIVFFPNNVFQFEISFQRIFIFRKIKIRKHPFNISFFPKNILLSEISLQHIFIFRQIRIRKHTYQNVFFPKNIFYAPVYYPSWNSPSPPRQSQTTSSETQPYLYAVMKYSFPRG
jgi:hypothetical protein